MQPAKKYKLRNTQAVYAHYEDGNYLVTFFDQNIAMKLKNWDSALEVGLKIATYYRTYLQATMRSGRTIEYFPYETEDQNAGF